MLQRRIWSERHACGQAGYCIQTVSFIVFMLSLCRTGAQLTELERRSMDGLAHVREYQIRQHSQRQRSSDVCSIDRDMTEGIFSPAHLSPHFSRRNAYSNISSSLVVFAISRFLVFMKNNILLISQKVQYQSLKWHIFGIHSSIVVRSLLTYMIWW